MELLLLILKIIGIYLAIGIVYAISTIIYYIIELYKEGMEGPDNGDRIGLAFVIMFSPLMAIMWPQYLIGDILDFFETRKLNKELDEQDGD